VKTTVALNADVEQVLNLLGLDPALVARPRKQWFIQIDAYRREMADQIQAEIDTGVGTENQLLVKTIVRRLSDLTGGRDLIVGDVGQHQMVLARFYNFQTVNSWFTSGGAGTMGCSLPMAIGVKLARPDERVWSVSGDGGFQMNIQELGTIMEHEIDVKILLMNNGYLGMVRQWQTLFYDGRYAGTPMKTRTTVPSPAPTESPTAGFPGWMRLRAPCSRRPITTGPSWWSFCVTPARSFYPWCRPAAA